MPKIFVFALAITSFLFFTPQVFASNLKINEFVAHPTGENKEWVEFYNPDNLDLSTYWLDDDTDFTNDTGSSGKKSLGGYNNSNSTFPYLEFSSFLNNSEDYVVLFDSSGAIIDQHQYTKDPEADVSFGRSPDGTDSISQLVFQTKGSTNSQIKPDEPTPSPSPSQTTTISSSSSTKSPTPSPKHSPITQVPKTPSLTPKSSPKVLAEKDSQSSTPSAQQEMSSPSPSPITENSPSKFKAASLLTGTGLALIGVSFALYLWYSKRLAKSDSKDNEKNI